MGCKRVNYSILWILFIIGISVFTFVFPPPDNMRVSAATVIAVTFDPDSNLTIDVWPTSYDFGAVYMDSNFSTPANKFSIANNGTGAVNTTIQMTGTAVDMTLVTGAYVITGNNKYGLHMVAGTISNSSWVMSSTTEILTNNIGGGGTTQTWKMVLYTGPSLTMNFSKQFTNLTVVGNLVS